MRKIQGHVQGHVCLPKGLICFPSHSDITQSHGEVRKSAHGRMGVSWKTLNVAGLSAVTFRQYKLVLDFLDS